MKKLLMLSVAVFFIVTVVFSQVEKYSRVKIYSDANGINTLAGLGIPLDNAKFKTGFFLIAELSETDIKTIANNGFKYDILIDDMSKYYVEQNLKNEALINDHVIKMSKVWPVPNGFTLGTMGGFSKYEEYLAHLDNMVSMYPNFITAKMPASATINTIEGKPVYYVKITNLSNGIPNKPQVLLTGLHHAREPIGMQHLLYFMYYIMQHYSDNQNIKNLIDYTEIFLIPVINVDGYLYNQTIQPNGGGMWRKNRRLNTGGSYGVDLNRNYGYMWGYDNNGSSPNPTSETYRGTAAFSEPETQIIRDFCNARNIKICLNYHSVAALFLHPWGYSASPNLPDLTTYTAYSSLLTKENHYPYGPCSHLLYNANGGSDDWMYGEQTSKPKIFAWTPEVGGSGFWPTSAEIIALCQENMWQSLYAAFLAGNFAFVTETSPYNISQMNGYFKFNIQRLGLQNTPTFTVSIIPIGTHIQSVGGPKTFNSMALLESRNDSISYTLNPTITRCQVFKFVISLNNGLYSITDTITKIYGPTAAMFTDNCNSMTNWTPANLWGISTSQYHSPTGSIADSPSGNYSNNQGSSNSVTLTNAINLNNKCFASLSFWAKWNIEAGYDFVQVKVSTNNGTSWTPLAGRYTKPGSPNQISGSPLYDGVQTSWVKEEIDLAPYVGQNIKIRFTLQSDNYTVADGFYFDDVSITAMDAYVGLNESPNDLNFISDAIPNPAINEFQLNFNLENSVKNSALVIYNSLGQEIYNYLLPANQGNVRITTHSWDKGVYFFMIKGNNYKSEIKKLILL